MEPDELEMQIARAMLAEEQLAEAVERERVLREALADAIRRPMGVIPTSAEGILTADELDAAETRRVATEPKEVK